VLYLAVLLFLSGVFFGLGGEQSASIQDQVFEDSEQPTYEGKCP